MNSFFSSKNRVVLAPSFLVLVIVAFSSISNAYDATGSSVRRSIPESPLTEGPVTVPRDLQRYVIIESFVNPDPLMQKVFVTIDGKSKLHYEPLDGVIFKFIEDRAFERISESLRTNSKGLSPYDVYYQATSDGYFDLAFVNKIEISEFCRLDLVGYVSSKKSCLWYHLIRP